MAMGADSSAAAGAAGKRGHKAPAAKVGTCVCVDVDVYACLHVYAYLYVRCVSVGAMGAHS